MPTLTRWYVKTALVYFVLSLVVGAALFAGPVFNLPAVVFALNPVYFHLLMVGWVTQLIFGIVYWMFPRYTKEQPRGSEKLAWAVFGLLNAGLLLRAVAEPLAAVGQGAWAPLLTASAVLQLAAGWGFVVNTWARVKER